MSVECSVDWKTYPWCRICLTSNVRMCSIASIQLQEVYEKLTSIQIGDNHGVPQVICFICYSQLRRVLRFSQMARRSQTILEDMRLAGLEGHQTTLMPDLEIGLKLSVTDIYTISIPNYSNNEYSRDPDVVCAKCQKTIIKEETVSDEDVKLEEIYSTSGENETTDICTISIPHYSNDDNPRDSDVVCAEFQKTIIKEETVSGEDVKLEEIYSTSEENETTDICPISIPHYSNDDNPRDPDVVCAEFQKTIIKEETVCDEDVKLEEIYSTPEENEICVTDGAMIHNEVVYELEATKSYLNTESALHPPLRTHTGKTPYECVICNKAFGRKCNLILHNRTHTGEKPYKCETCNKAFTQPNGLKDHIRTHTGEKPYECEICNKAFTQKCNLKEHIRIHTGEKPYKCESCNIAFTHKQSLKQHIRIHTGEKPYKCETCNKAFHMNSILKSHIKTHFGEKPYKCETCNKAFTNKNSLKVHIRIHTGEKPYKCESCNKAFPKKSHLKSHIQTHIGEKPYKCETCNKAFTHKNILKQHIIIHAGEKPYKCETCNKAFTQKNNLKQHIRTHTGENPL